MYNRYIPQPDGSHRRTYVESPRDEEAAKKEAPCAMPIEPLSPPIPASKNTSKERPISRSYLRNRPTRQNSRERPSEKRDNPGDFLKNILPKDFDTSDLFVVLLLLLMAGDSSEDTNTALLTLALYFFM